MERAYLHGTDAMGHPPESDSIRGKVGEATGHGNGESHPNVVWKGGRGGGRSVGGRSRGRSGDTKAAVAGTTGQRAMDWRASGEVDAQKQP